MSTYTTTQIKYQNLHPVPSASKPSSWGSLANLQVQSAAGDIVPTFKLGPIKFPTPHMVLLS